MKGRIYIMKNRKNNKGFSLVELIVVVAIMAVLVGVLAPAYLRYVEKSRTQKDESAVAEVIEAVKIACAEEDVANDVTTATTVTINNTDIVVNDDVTPASGTNTNYLQVEIDHIIESIELTSKTHKDQTYTITITAADENGITVADYNDSNWAD